MNMEGFPKPDTNQPKKKGLASWKKVLGLGAAVLGAVGVGKAMETDQPDTLSGGSELERPAEESPREIHLMGRQRNAEGRGGVKKEEAQNADQKEEASNLAKGTKPIITPEMLEKYFDEHQRAVLNFLTNEEAELRDARDASIFSEETRKEQELSHESRLRDIKKSIVDVLVGDLNSTKDPNKERVASAILATYEGLVSTLRGKGYRLPNLSR